MVYDVKHDGRHKSRLVAQGHLTEPNTESVYSSVVSLRGIRLVTFLSELDNLELWGTDIGNAYLEATTKERVYIVGGCAGTNVLPMFSVHWDSSNASLKVISGCA
jgi:Reverse transcriptase (RNA-dependent DNA polymerase)